MLLVDATALLVIVAAPAGRLELLSVDVVVLLVAIVAPTGRLEPFWRDQNRPDGRGCHFYWWIAIAAPVLLPVAIVRERDGER